MDIPALQLTSRFSSAPNSLGYCGLNSAQKTFYDCLVNQQCDNVPHEVLHFKGLYPYLSTIAEVTNKHFLDYEVVEAYWLGNDLLAKFKPEHYEILLKHLAAEQLPEFFITELRQRPPRTFIPLHIFNVIHVGVGRITGSVPFNLDSINNCMIRWGTVEIINHDQETANIILHSLKSSQPNQYAVDLQPSTITFTPEFHPNLKTGDIVAAHWGQLVKILTIQEQQHLQFWTEKILTDIINL